MNDEQFAVLRAQEEHLLALANSAKAASAAATDVWWIAHETIKAEERRREIEAEVQKRLAAAS